MLRPWPLALLLLAPALCTGCTRGAAGPRAIEQLRVRVVASYPHDRAAYTQGLEWHGGRLYESTGLVGRSTLRRVELETGVVEQRVDLPSELFGEGLTRVGRNFIQLTWQDGRAIVWDAATLRATHEFRYPGEGWGLCHDGERLVMSDGSDRLVFRSPATFEKLGEVQVTLDGQPLRHLNELECVDGEVYANVWQTDHIARIDPRSGRVTAWIDAAGLLTPAERAGAEVLNGIAYVRERDRFLVTGKLWPRLFEVVFVPASAQ